MGGVVRSVASFAGGIMSGLFGDGTTGPPRPGYEAFHIPAPPPVPTAAAPEVQDAERRMRIATGKAAGRASTMLTGGEGITLEEEKAKTASRTLLG